MALRKFRRSKKVNIMRSYSSDLQLSALDMTGMEQLCVGLSEDHIDSLSTFRVEANMYKARSSDESIGVAEALRYLRATKFNASKAIDVFKNYHKHRDSYQLDNLRPHRNPLSNEIGTKKLEIVGSYDSDGTPLVLFTVARHDMKASDHKASMQLIFYTLDQVAESDPESDVVIIMDMRDISITSFDVRYVTNMLSVFRDGYPILVKAIYIVNAPIWVKTHVAVSKAFKQDVSKVHFVTGAELSSKYFSSSQLPHSLGGTYVPGTHKSNPPPKPSPHHQQRHHTNGDGITSLVKAFGGSQSGAGHTPSTGSTSKPLRPHPPSKPKPTPLSRVGGTKVGPVTPPKNRSREGGNESSPAQLGVRKTFSNGDQGHRSDASKPRVPLLPRTGASKPPSPSLQGGVAPSPVTPSFQNKGGSPTRGNVGFKVRGGGAGGVGGQGSEGSEQRSVASRIKRLEGKSHSHDWQGGGGGGGREKESHDWHGGAGREKEGASSKLDERRRSGSAGSQAANGGSPSQSKQGSPSKGKKPQKPLIPVKLLPDKETRSKDIGSRPSHMTSSSAERTSARVPPPHAPPPQAPPPYASTQSQVHNVSPYASTAFAMGNSAHKYDGGEYENVEVTQTGENPGGRGQQQAQPAPCSYENVAIKKSRTHQKPPVQRRYSIPVPSDTYENVEFQPLTSKPSPHPPSTGPRLQPSGPRPPSEEHVSDDDDVLFGKEGPPGMTEVIYENFGPDAGNKEMTVSELEEHIRKKETKGLSAEYYKIKNEPLCGSYQACRLKCNLPKNRYKDVVCYDETRVALQSVPGVEGSDYIHANYVTGYNRPQAFILTQGPKDKTVIDFWRMVWEKNIRVIVMITKCVELGKRKCAQYWPETTDSEPIRHGHVTIHMTKSVNAEGYDVHTLKVASAGVERTITHYQFLAWPDYGVPSSGQQVLQLVFSVRKAQSRLIQGMDLAKLRLPPHGPPVLVHCSAGVGRSGAFCALDVAIDELKDTNRVNLQGIVRQMRTERAYCVQTDEQYEFCYRTILEYGKSMS